MIGFIISSVLTYGLWEVVPHKTLLFWMLIILLVSCIRLLLIFHYRRNFKPELASQYAFYLIISSASGGLAWGLSGVMLFPQHEIEYQFFLLLVLGGVSLGSTSSLTTYLPAFYACLPPLVLPISTMFLLINDPIHLSLGGFKHQVQKVQRDAA